MRVRLRRAGLSDSDRIFRWRNDPSVYRFLFAAQPVSRRSHDRWMERRLTDSGSRLFIALLDGRPAGQVRLDAVRGPRAEIGVALAPRAQGRGAGAASIIAAEPVAKRLGVRRLTARVLPENIASAVAFLKAGYRFVRWADCGGRRAYLLEKAL